MLKKTITFDDLDGNSLTEDFYFNLSKAEITEMELSQKGGLSAYLQKIVKTEDTKELITIFKELIVKSVGRRSDDGRRFVKNQEITDDFMQTEAYSELFMELATRSQSAVEFIKGIFPAGLEKEMEKLVADRAAEAGKTADTAETADIKELPSTEPEVPSWITEGREPTDKEVREATPEQLRLAYQRKNAAKPE